MLTLKEMREKLSALVTEMDGIISGADKAKRELSEDEEKRFNEVDVEITELQASITEAEDKEKRMSDMRDKAKSLKSDLKKSANSPMDRRDDFAKINTNKDEADYTKEFRNFGEFIHSVRYNPQDKRLDDLYDPGVGIEVREQNMKNGTDGGFMVPTQFVEAMRSIEPDSAIFRPRATVIPAGSPPDAEIEIPVLNQSSAENIYGGVQVQWIDEGDTKPETDLKLDKISLKPHEVAAHIIVTDKLLRNWGAASSILSSKLRGAMIGAEEYAFFTGNGVAKPMGVLNSPARIDYTRATASTITYADVVGMLARMIRRGGSPIWTCNQTIIPQLANIRDTGNNNIFVFNAAQGIPATLLGYPIVFNERVPSLGTRGDLCLLDLSEYLIKDGSGPFVATSEHVFFRQNKTVIKAFWNVDGQGAMNEPMALESNSATVGGAVSATTVSPFIILN